VIGLQRIVFFNCYPEVAWEVFFCIVLAHGRKCAQNNVLLCTILTDNCNRK